MANKERTTLIELLNSQKAFDLLGEDAGLFGDNGGDPDGDSWLTEASYLNDAAIDKAIEAKVARRVKGWRVTPYTAANNYCNWAGYQANGEAFFLDDDQADACFYDEAGIEDTAG